MASTVISTLPASALDTGQPSWAPSAALAKPSASRPGTEPRTVRATLLMCGPPSRENVTTAEVSSVSGGVPSLARAPDSAIEKHEE